MQVQITDIIWNIKAFRVIMIVHTVGRGINEFVLIRQVME